MAITVPVRWKGGMQNKADISTSYEQEDSHQNDETRGISKKLE
jgi:hypothetical protein